jgi:exopolysaccharide biosynthesis protein
MPALLLALALLLGLCACSNAAELVKGAAPPAPAPETTEAEPIAEPTPEPTAEPTEEPTAEPTEEPTQEPTAEPTAEPTPDPTPEPIVGETLTDEDGDGIISYRFFYKGASVYALIVLDPSRVYVGTALPEPQRHGGSGLTLDALAEQYEAVAGINAGGFKDDEGTGSGWPPRGITYSHGVNFEGEQYGPIAGLDADDHLWSGYYDYNDCEVIGIRDAVCFGPYLVMDGVKTDPSELESGIGARTAIGQREDGAIVLVAIDGRQGYSIGVTFADLIDIMADKFCCVNASNMDGGNSTAMYYRGEAVNRSANQAAGTRSLPDAWLVSPLPADYVKPESVPDSVVIPDNALGEKREYVSACDEETCQRMYQFSLAFLEAYYGYFGTQWADRHYPDLLRYVAEDCDLRYRADLALMDRKWVNTWGNTVSNVVLDGAYSNGDGTYDILLTLDVLEQSAYWKYRAEGIQLRITVVEAPETTFGFLATATY